MRLTYAQWKHTFEILILFSKKKKKNFLITCVAVPGRNRTLFTVEYFDRTTVFEAL